MTVLRQAIMHEGEGWEIEGEGRVLIKPRVHLVTGHEMWD